MRLEGFRFRNIRPFRDVDVDLTQLPDTARLVAVTGVNGAGKSVSLETALPGAMFRQTATRGPLAGLATARDSMVESRVVNGQRITIRHTLDCVSGKSEAVVLDENGSALLPDAKVRSFDRWAAKHLPSPEVFFSSVFAAQGSGGLLDMSKGDRKGVILRALGIERLEALAERAREHARGAKTQIETVRARLTDERERNGDAAELEQQLDDARAAVVTADEAVTKTRQALDDARAEAARIERLTEEALATAAKRAELGDAIEAERKRLSDLENRVANNRAVLEEAEAIEAAVERLAALEREKAEADSAMRDARTQAEQTRAEEQQHRNASRAASARAEQALQRCERARQRLADRERIETAVASVERLRDLAASTDEHVTEAEAALEQTRDKRIAGAEERIDHLRGGFVAIADEPEAMAKQIAEDTLRADDAAVEAAAAIPAAIAEAEQALRKARTGHDNAREALAEAEALAARAGDLEAAAADLEAATQEREQAADEATRELEAAEAAEQSVELIETQRGEHSARLAELDQERERLAPMARKADPLAGAQARLEELEPQVAEVRDRLAKLRQDLADTPVSASPPPLPDVSAANSALENAAKSSRDAHSRVAVLEQQLETARAATGRIEALEAEAQGLEHELADWTKLAQDLGRDGLQAMEIDCAGPELTELSNDLLHSCFGPRYTLSFDTTRASADGKRTIEDFEIKVLDNVDGTEVAATLKSGGQRVIVSEAAALALTVVACRRHGVESPSLVRDESGAALDGENGRAYVAMLRRAADMVNADRVFFVSHAPELQELADARLVVRDGTITVN